MQTLRVRRKTESTGGIEPQVPSVPPVEIPSVPAPVELPPPPVEYPPPAAPETPAAPPVEVPALPALASPPLR